MSVVNGFQVGSDTLKYNYESLENYNTPNFSTSSTYDVGDYVMYNGKLYRCKTAISTAGAWDSSKWDLAVLSDDVSDLKNEINIIDDNLFIRRYYPSNITVNADGQIYLEKGYIYAATGASGSSSTGKYYRTQVGASGSRPALEIGNYSLLARLGLDWVQWTCWSYSSTTFASATHSNCDGKYVSGSVPIYIPYNSTDKRFIMSFRKGNGSEAFTDEELSTLKNSIRFYTVNRTPSPSIIWFGDSITRGRIGGASSLTDYPIPFFVSRELNIRCENFGIGDIGWCAGYSSQRTNWTNLVGYMKRVGNPDYYAANDAYNGYKFRGSGNWDDFNTIVIAVGTNDTGYPLGSLEDIDDTLSYAEVMAWKTSAADSNTGGNRTIVKAMYQAYRYIRESEDYHIEGDPYVPGGKYKRIIICDPIISGNMSTGTPPLWGYTTVRDGGYTRIQMNQLYADFAERYGCEHISTYDAPIDRMHLANSLPDGVHPNSNTYHQLGRYFAGKILSGDCVATEVTEEIPEGVDLLKKYGTFTTETKNNVTFTWNNGSCTVSISGSASATTIQNIIDSRNLLPLGINPGDRLALIFDKYAPNNVRWRVLFWNANGEQIKTYYYYHSLYQIDVPAEARGISVQLYIPNGATLTNPATIYSFSLVKVPKMEMTTPLIVTFVDDDTTNATYVQKYHDACKHNGVYGTYATLGNSIGNNDNPTEGQITNKNLLLQYEDEGFGVVVHANTQNSSVYDAWHSSDDEDVATCRADLASAMRYMRNNGFLNYLHWITPYGVHNSGTVRIARELGTKNLISYNNGVHNSMVGSNKYYIKRVALGENDTDQDNSDKTMAIVKAAVDDAVEQGGAWIIITTHFNEWGSLTWDDTLDENGYPIGYSRFNEIVQYALGKGLTPMTLPAAWTLYEPILEANKKVMNEKNALN